tara:strand:- start:418 stop:867 length:450 start_codon:yes stop_codon:yes gene_type:complete
MASKELQDVTYSAQAGNVSFMPAIFDETLQLLLESHEYFEYYGAEEQAIIPEYCQVIFSSEMSRITMRLTSIMAWIMVRKAVYAGKLSEEEARRKYRLDGRSICLLDNVEARAWLPDFVVYLLDESLELYARVARLDDMAYAHERPTLH